VATVQVSFIFKMGGVALRLSGNPKTFINYKVVQNFYIELFDHIRNLSRHLVDLLRFQQDFKSRIFKYQSKGPLLMEDQLSDILWIGYFFDKEILSKLWDQRFFTLAQALN